MATAARSKTTRMVVNANSEFGSDECTSISETGMCQSVFRELLPQNWIRFCHKATSPNLPFLSRWLHKSLPEHTFGHSVQLMSRTFVTIVGLLLLVAAAAPAVVAQGEPEVCSYLLYRIDTNEQHEWTWDCGSVPTVAEVHAQVKTLVCICAPLNAYIHVLRCQSHASYAQLERGTV